MSDAHDKTLDALEAYLKQKLKDNPQLLLPNAHNVYVDERKYLKYLFGGSNKKGLTKGALITKILGYGLHNYRQLDSAVRKAISEFPARFRAITAFGVDYEIVVILKGITKPKAKVILGALVDKSNSRVTSIYIKEISQEDFT